MNDNRLIAEFMEVDRDILSTGNVHSWSDSPFFYITENTKEKTMEGVANYVKYHSSWDWLMPVVRELLGLKRYKNTQLERLRLEYALNKVDIELTHEAVVDFIKAYTYERQ